MIRKLFLAVLYITLSLAATAQINPEDFLGYKIGTAFTPHYKIAAYFNQLAQLQPASVKIEQYGTTYEGRPLLIAIISSPENISRLNEIRQQNKNLVTNGGSTLNTSIVWLSYNVHGNEPSSSEAAMQTAFALIDPSNNKTKAWLKNTIVIIDPCLNPDGRDRYVNWYNSVKGNQYNSDPQSREHSEPWPGGRSNHYNFDLNRDWAWQTQKETRQRIQKYNEWMPHIHVDFHEQYYDNPYYFAPAAEPFHAVITPWQRELQTLIGKNNAKYFDENNWLFFTRQEFDLFYPSYGDTYPTYNGSVGMTYEQGGHSRGGLGVITSDKDTLTLVERVTHHYTTGLSTIEVASQQQKKITEEFARFFEASRNAENSEFKTYILSSSSKIKIESLKKLLASNGIEFGNVQLPKGLKGFNYFADKEDFVSTEKYTVAISAYQPKSVLAKVLLEPKGSLSDSVTYDITAWSLPYAYGINCFGVKQKLTVTTEKEQAVKQTIPAGAYGYLMEWNAFSDATALASLLKQGVRVRVSEKDFTSAGKQYIKGTLIILRNANQPAALTNILQRVADSFHCRIDVIASGFVEKGSDFGSADVRTIKAPRVAMFTGEQVSSLAAGEVWHLFDEQLQYPVSLLNASEYNWLTLSNYDVIILPSGNYRFLNDKTAAEKLLDFVRNGGKLIALENAVNQLASLELLKSKEHKETDKDDSADYTLLKKYEDRVRNEVPDAIPGAIFKIELDNTHPLAFGYPATYYTLKQSANGFDFLKNGWNVGVIKKSNLVTGFVGSKLKPQLTDDVLIGEIPEGRGSIIFFADDPLFRAFWENGKLLFANAVFVTR